MNFIDRIRLILHILRWRLNWSKKNLNYTSSQRVSNKFITASEAAKLVKNNSVVFSNGLAGNARCSVFFWAIRERFIRHEQPCNLTWINVGAQGGRGKVPGTIEELGLPGLITQYIAGHLETCKAQLKLAQQDQLELHTLPQGVMSFLLEAQAGGKDELRSEVGIGTFLDPRVGKGSALTPGAENQYVQVDGALLKYRMPPIDLALINAPYADSQGNIYFRDAAAWTENLQSARAAKANGGLVMVTVSKIIPISDSEISMRAEDVDHVVLHPYNEQTASIPQRNYWPMFTENARVDVHKAIEQLRFINNVLRITPVRGPVEFALARLGAKVFTESVSKGAMVNIGVGFPEEVARQLVDHGLASQLLFTTEAGVYGGLPAPGIFFSAAVGPEHLEPSSTMFERYANGLDVAILGFLQVDGQGNVNASHRGPRLTDVVGPGGFPDIATGAKTIVFVGSWMAKAKFAIENGMVKVIQPGKCKFVKAVDHITFSASEALRLGKIVFYVTHVGVFKLTSRGLELQQVMPGIDIQSDILEVTQAEIQIPPAEERTEINQSVVTDVGFSIELRG